MSNLTMNGICSSLVKEARISENGVNGATVGEYKANNSDFGQKFKKGMLPKRINPR